MFRRSLFPALALIVAFAAVEPASAQRFREREDTFFQRGGQESWAGPQDEKQREVPLSSILRDLRQRYGGQHLDANKNGNRWIIAWITQDGRRLTIEVDAASGRVLSTR